MTLFHLEPVEHPDSTISPLVHWKGTLRGWSYVWLVKHYCTWLFFPLESPQGIYYFKNLSEGWLYQIVYRKGDNYTLSHLNKWIYCKNLAYYMPKCHWEKHWRQHSILRLWCMKWQTVSSSLPLGLWMGKSRLIMWRSYMNNLSLE